MAAKKTAPATPKKASKKAPNTETKARKKTAPRTRAQGSERSARAVAARKRPRKEVASPVSRRQVPCLECGLCCTYIAVEIDPPTTVNRATQMLWYLYHERVSVYWDNEDDWIVQFETPCRHLGVDNKCGIYEVRPQICRDFDESACEINAKEEGTTFFNAAQFLDFLKARRKAIYRKLDGFIPDPSSLVGPPGRRSKLAPFETRYRRLRVLGAGAP